MLHYYPRTGDLFHNKSWLAATKKKLQRNMKVLSLNIYIQKYNFYVALLHLDGRSLPQQELAGRHKEKPTAQHEGTILYLSIDQYL